MNQPFSYDILLFVYAVVLSACLAAVILAPTVFVMLKHNNNQQDEQPVYPVSITNKEAKEALIFLINKCEEEENYERANELLTLYNEVLMKEEWQQQIPN